MSKTFKESSRGTFTETQTSHEGIRTGSLQRIADAIEIIARDKLTLEQELARYKARLKDRDNEIAGLYRENRSLKSVATRYKNKIKSLTKPKDQEHD